MNEKSVHDGRAITGERKDTWAAGRLYEPYVGRWSRLVAKDLLAWLDLPPELDWLDVGCGTGALAETILLQVQPRTVKGVDPSAGFVEHARAHIVDAKATFEVADARALPGGPDNSTSPSPAWCSTSCPIPRSPSVR